MLGSYVDGSPRLVCLTGSLCCSGRSHQPIFCSSNRRPSKPRPPKPKNNLRPTCGTSTTGTSKFGVRRKFPSCPQFVSSKRTVANDFYISGRNTFQTPQVVRTDTIRTEYVPEVGLPFGIKLFSKLQTRHRSQSSRIFFFFYSGPHS